MGGSPKRRDDIFLLQSRREREALQRNNILTHIVIHKKNMGEIALLLCFHSFIHEL